MINPILYVFTGVYDYQLRWGESHATARNLAAMTAILPVNFIILSVCLVLANVLDFNLLDITKSVGAELEIPYEAVWVIFAVPLSLVVVYITCIKNKQYINYYNSTFNAKYIVIKSLSITLSCVLFSFLCMYLFG